MPGDESAVGFVRAGRCVLSSLRFPWGWARGVLSDFAGWMGGNGDVRLVFTLGREEVCEEAADDDDDETDY